MNLEGFVGGLELPISRSINPARTLNLYVEADPGTPKRKTSMIIRPALVPFTVIAPGPVRSLFFQDDRFFGVSGTSTSYYYEIDKSSNVTQLGQMVGDNNPASICSNGTGGNQNMIVSGGSGYIHDLVTNSFVQITDAEFLTPSQQAIYFETYFLNLQQGTNTFQLSAQLDGLNWNGIDVGQCSLTADQKFSFALLSRTLFFGGQKNIEPWYNSGNANFPIQPESGVTVEHGVLAPNSWVNLDNTLYWVAQDAIGQCTVRRFNGYTPEIVSTPPVANMIRQWESPESTIGFAFQKNNHTFYCLYNSHAETTLAYDVSTGLWVEFSRWDTRLLRDFPLPIRCAASGWGRTFVGSTSSGVIYELSLGVYADEVVP